MRDRKDIHSVGRKICREETTLEVALGGKVVPKCVVYVSRGRSVDWNGQIHRRFLCHAPLSLLKRCEFLDQLSDC